MTARRDDDDDDEALLSPPWHMFQIALVPYRRFEGEDPERGPPVFLDFADEDERRIDYFYMALLSLRWLSPAVRRAVMSELGISPREQQFGINQLRAITFQISIRNREAQLRKDRTKRSFNREHGDALADVAEKLDMSVENLKKFIQRYGLKDEELDELQAHPDRVDLYFSLKGKRQL